ncbi:putative protein OS=Tsukamurella paurometabola (strain ATCC 8368 / DSM / CCUG 35730 /CIP 100753 / JCM 10117 / KCTC 9821 / NBRC 16120 / NCIMB 702349/ NCTC 13040) OX=521096 GN=Tpau_4314 PE=4 SV=1 [Tsukamurella paurometabola]|uniref:Uncharacterized protein n=1 Tax=Tsukamurella paurometabola (strain ATCC 8368 / DSM 20162 / CCUG 35730 / CIP 100753 / JCM 10117 / KCTC 9821 / NBRC 16120 / NCIMB 702349 / NCTC 13040) TaxID=521096 RepID=D5UZ28_TSUPD|nr:hypothetical protein Tpau_4314 [Tsukamurella paurometabola DSM 20162]SUQ39241.1 Uncharacterised protein [Tsukamurella paurometabola]
MRSESPFPLSSDVDQAVASVASSWGELTARHPSATAILDPSVVSDGDRAVTLSDLLGRLMPA